MAAMAAYLERQEQGALFLCGMGVCSEEGTASGAIATPRANQQEAIRSMKEAPMLSPAQLRTLALLSQGAATRHYYRERSGEYTWVHPAAPKPITPTLHRLFVKGLATVCEMDKNRAVITPRGQQVLLRAA
jgi:hypothetical protein